MQMKRHPIILLIVTTFVVVGVVFWWSSRTAVAPQQPVATEYKNATYMIAGQSVTLVNGYAESPAASGSVSQMATKYFGNEAIGDLNGDGVPDVGFLLTQSTGGSGTFYYAVAAIKTVDGYRGTDAVLLGDRIAPQTSEIRDGKLLINYADRAPGESFAVRPSNGKSLWLKLDQATMQFGIVVQNFEGEADPSIMKLTMKTWEWVSTRYNNDTTVMPKRVNAFSVTFNSDGTFSATTDCNRMSGKYVTQGKNISFSSIATTMMYCEGSQEAEFGKMLSEVQNYLFSSKGELIFNFKFDSGSFIFH